MSTTQHYRTPLDEPIDERILAERAPSVGQLFRRRVELTPDQPAFLYPDGDQWRTVTWAEVRDRVYRLAAGLVALGVGPEDRVAIASSTRYEWALADLAVMCAGAATTTVYPTTIADDVAFILEDSGTSVVFAEDQAQFDKLRGIRDAIPGVAHVVTFDPTTGGEDDWGLSFSELERLGAEFAEVNPGVVDERIDATTPERLATIIYTSGTTGRPKGVRLLHDAWTYQAAAAEAMGDLNPDDLQYLWLPLAHVFGKNLLTIPIQIGFPTAIDGRIDKIVENLAVVRPTWMGAAPRIFEKVHARISMMFAQETGLKRRLIDWSMATAYEAQGVREAGGEVAGLLAGKLAVADRLVLSKVRERFGGRVRYFLSGSAALNQDVARWFQAVGLMIGEGYGLTESSAGAFVARIRANRIGTVGWALPGLEARIDDDGELLLRGPGIMEGYHNNPEATAEVLDADGWFHTGDIAEMDEEGFLRITDRKKDLFKTSNGKYVAPALIESHFKGMCPYVSQLVVQGADRNYVTALVTLDQEAIMAWAEANGMSGKSYAEVVGSPQAHELVQSYIDEFNSGLNRWEQIKRFTILGRELTVEAGELTPSLKLRRRVVSATFHDEIDALYPGP